MLTLTLERKDAIVRFLKKNREKKKAIEFNLKSFAIILRQCFSTSGTELGRSRVDTFPSFRCK